MNISKNMLIKSNSNSNKIINNIPKNNSQENQTLSIPKPVSNNSTINKSIHKPVNTNLTINQSIPKSVSNNSTINKSIPKSVNNNSTINQSTFISEPIKSIPKPVSTNTLQNRSILNFIKKTEPNHSTSNIDNISNLNIHKNKSNPNQSTSNNNCPHNKCPYLPRKVVTEKQAEKEPIGSFYHPTEKTYRTGACDIGYVLKRGYERESYKKKDGTIINATYVDPVCIKNKGLNGKLLEEYKPIHLDNKNELSVYGYDTKSKIHERLNALIKAIDKLTYKSVILRISALRTLHKNNPHYYKLFDKDLKNLQLLHSLGEFGYKINISEPRRMISLKKASEKLTFKKVLSILKKLRNIYKTDEVFQNVFNKDILMLEEYYKK